MKKSTTTFKISLAVLTAGLATLTLGNTARAERIYAVTDNAGAGAAGSLVYFDSLSPSAVTTVAALSERPTSGPSISVLPTGSSTRRAMPTQRARSSFTRLARPPAC